MSFKDKTFPVTSSGSFAPLVTRETDPKLWCYANDCPLRWTVEKNNKKTCGYHAWVEVDEWPEITLQLQQHGPWKREILRPPLDLTKHRGDRLGWAKRIQDRDDAGKKITPTVREMYKTALRIGTDKAI